MNLDDYISKREAHDPEFQAARAALQPEYEFRRKLIQARLSAGLTQQQLAERIGTKQSAIARLEGGDAEPSFAMLRLLAMALNVSFEILPTAAVKTHVREPIQATS